MSLQDVRDVLHKIVDAAVGVGRQAELHGDIDAIGAPAPVSPDPTTAPSSSAADTSPSVSETADAGAGTEAVPADELAAFRAWQATQVAGVVSGGATDETVSDAEAQS